MGTAKRQNYFYRMERDGAFQRKVYYGRGTNARAAAAADRALRQARRDTLDQVRILRGLLRCLELGIDASLAARLTTADWRFRNREWKEPPWQA